MGLLKLFGLMGLFHISPRRSVSYVSGWGFSDRQQRGNLEGQTERERSAKISERQRRRRRRRIIFTLCLTVTNPKVSSTLGVSIHNITIVVNFLVCVFNLLAEKGRSFKNFEFFFDSWGACLAWDIHYRIFLKQRNQLNSSPTMLWLVL